MSAKLTDPERDHAAQVVAKFSVLIRAWHTNNFHEAARVEDELERLVGAWTIHHDYYDMMHLLQKHELWCSVFFLSDR